MAASIPAFTPKDTDAEPGAINAATDEYYSIAGRISGTGSTLRAQINYGAMPWSDLVAEPIQKQKNFSASAWQRAMQGAVWGAGVSDAWHKNVFDFKKKRDDLIAEWQAAVAGNFGVTKSEYSFGHDMSDPKVSATVDKMYDGAVEQAAQAKLGELTGKFNALWKQLEKDGTERGQELKEGPTPENLKALVEAGALGWAGFNLWGNKSAVPVTDKDGKRLAELLKLAMKNGGKLPRELELELANLRAVADHAVWLQLNGGKLTKDELAYLKAFYDGIGGEAKVVTENGVNKLVRTGALFNLDKWFADGKFTDDQKHSIRYALGGGLLALSDEGIGGGFGMLPEDVRREMGTEVPKYLLKEPGAVQDQWAAGLGLLAPVLSAANPNMHAGKQFSADMILRSADYAMSLDPKQRDVLQDFLGVGVRNKEASAAVLHGEYKHSDYGKNTPEYVLRQLFSSNWSDKGQTASHLIDWIDEDMGSKDAATRKLAYQAGYDAFTTMTSIKDNGFGDSAFKHFLNRVDGHKGFLGVENPYVAQALGDIIAPRLLDTFATGTDGVANGLHGDRMTLDEATRIRVFELAMTDSKTADGLGSTIYARAIDDAGGLDAWKFGTAGRHGTENGRLIGLLDAAVDNIKGGTGPGLEDGKLAAQAAKDDARIVRWANMGAAVLKEVVTAHPAIDKGSAFVKTGSKVMFELAKTMPGVTNTEGWWTTAVKDDGMGGPATDMRYAPLHGQIGRATVEGMLSDPKSGLSTDDFRHIIKNTGNGLTESDLLKDGHLKSWKDIPAGDRERAVEILENAIQKQGKNDEYEKYLRELGAIREDTGNANKPSKP